MRMGAGLFSCVNTPVRCFLNSLIVNAFFVSFCVNRVEGIAKALFPPYLCTTNTANPQSAIRLPSGFVPRLGTVALSFSFLMNNDAVFSLVASDGLICRI